jgi:large subunit ribosomal protein L1
MGKIRVKTIGDEDQEKKESKKALARAEAKKAAEAAKKAAGERAAAADDIKKETTKDISSAENASEIKEVKVEKKKVIVKKEAKQKHSKAYFAVASKVDKNKKYNLNEALSLLEQLKRVKFDETVELHINTLEKGVSGNFTLPHGTGKQTRIAIANQSEDAKGVEELVKKIEAGQIDFDVIIATPDAMPKLARVAKILGPRGLMPNPKNGTVSPTPAEVAKKFEGGQVNFKTESKFPLLHLAVGKLSFGDKKLVENIKVAMEAIKTQNIKDATLKSTMSPAIKLDLAQLS